MSRTEDRFDGYTVNPLLDDDGDYLAHFVELPNVSAFGPTPEKALKELDEAWALVKESYAEEGKELPVAPARREFGGVFQVRSGPISAFTGSSRSKRSARGLL